MSEQTPRQSPSDTPQRPPEQRPDRATPVPLEHAARAGAADLLGPKEVLEIQHHGRAAATAGEPVTACPWRQATEEIDRARRDMWVRGYAAGRTELRAARAGSAGAGRPAPATGLSPPVPPGGDGEGLSEGTTGPI